MKLKVKENIEARQGVRSKFRQAGMTLTESLLVLGIGAAVAVLAYGGYKMATGMVSASSQVRGVTQLAAGINRIYGVTANYSTLNNTNVVSSKIVPSDFKVNGTNITTAWGGAITVGPGNQAGATPNTMFKITINSVPTDNCVDFVSGIASAATTLWVNGTTVGTHDVKDSSGTYYPDRAATQCAASSAVNVILVSN